MNWFYLVVAVLASNAVVEFFRHSQLVEEWRLYWNTTTNFTSRLMRCGYCLSHWTAVVVFLFFISPRVFFGPSVWTEVLLSPAYILAIIRLSNLVSDLSHPFSRSPRRTDAVDDVHRVQDHE